MEKIVKHIGRKGFFGLILLLVACILFIFKDASPGLSQFLQFLTWLGGLFFAGNVGEHAFKKPVDPAP